MCPVGFGTSGNGSGIPVASGTPSNGVTSSQSMNAKTATELVVSPGSELHGNDTAVALPPNVMSGTSYCESLSK